jgi:hypothetical protein
MGNLKWLPANGEILPVIQYLNLPEDMTKKQKILIIVEFLKGWVGVALIVFAITTISILNKCKNESCFVTECVEVNEQCEQESYDPRTGESGNCCEDYESVEIPFRNLLLKQTALYTVASFFGPGLFVGIFLAERKYEKIKNV